MTRNGKKRENEGKKENKNILTKEKALLSLKKCLEKPPNENDIVSEKYIDASERKVSETNGNVLMNRPRKRKMKKNSDDNNIKKIKFDPDDGKE